MLLYVPFLGTAWYNARTEDEDTPAVSSATRALDCSDFPTQAAAEMARVLKSRGRLGLTDMTVNGPLPHGIQSLPAWLPCVAGAGTPQAYVTTLQSGGFADFAIEDQRDALLDRVGDVRCKLLGVELAAGLGQLNLGHLDLDEGNRLARRAVELIEDGVAGYTLITARKE